MFPEILIREIRQTNSSFHVKEHTIVSFPFFKSFLLALPKLLFLNEDWALGYDSMKFRQLPDVF